MESKKLRGVLVGLGFMGENWRNEIESSEDWQIAALVDSNQDLLQKRAKQWKIKNSSCFTDIEQALKGVKADAVFVCTPRHQHKTICLKAIEYGLHVIVEKPMANSFLDAKELVEKSSEKHTILMVSQNFRYRKEALTLKRVLKSNIVGTLGYGNITCDSPLNRPDWYATKLPYPMLLEMSVHHFDSMRSVFGLEPVSIFAKSWNPSWSWWKNGDPCVACIINFEKNVWVSYQSNWTSFTKSSGEPFIDAWQIRCSEGSIYLGDLGEGYRVYTEKKGEEGKYEKVQWVSCKPGWLGNTLDEFTRAIKSGVEPETSGHDNLKTLAMVLGAISSIERNAEFHISESLH